MDTLFFNILLLNCFQAKIVGWELGEMCKNFYRMQLIWKYIKDIKINCLDFLIE